MSVTELEQAFEKLSSQEQEQFAEWYEAKLAGGGFDRGNEEVWAVEVDRRLEEIRSGKVQGIPGEQVMAELRRRYGA
ncbi:MAG: addiction module protein [Opitutaceae bacterium]|jgi:putative addiction module component (TIGR02574 family)